MSTLKNRGKIANDENDFGDPKQVIKIKEAIVDLSHLLSRGYPEKSSLALVGSRYRLNARQQRAIQGMSASNDQIEFRNKNSLKERDINGKNLIIDGFNVVILLESLLSLAYIFKGVDNFYRDLSSVHGTYKKVQQTTRVIELIAHFYKESQPNKLHWIFDKPVSNSGRIKKMIEEFANNENLNWEVTLDFNPDKFIVESNEIAISSDAWILDNTNKNYNLIEYFVVNQLVPNTFIINP